MLISTSTGFIQKLKHRMGEKCIYHESFLGNVKNGKVIFELYGESRGDYKFGLAAGYIGSFRYQLSWNDQCLQGEGGYCEYIACRPLRWQEKNQNEKCSINCCFYSRVYIKMNILSFWVKRPLSVNCYKKGLQREFNGL